MKYLRPFAAVLLSAGFLQSVSAQTNTFPSSGNVGIGTTNPLKRLHVYDNTTTNEAVLIEGTVANGYTQALFKGTGRQWQLGVGNAGETGLGVANKFYVYDAGAAAMRFTIDGAGTVLVNSNDFTITGAAPTTVYKDIDGKTGYWHVNSNIMYLLSGPQGAGYGAWAQVNSRWPLEFNLTNNFASFGGNAAFGAHSLFSDAIVNASSWSGNAMAFHGLVGGNGAIGAMFEVINGANTSSDDLLVLRRRVDGGVPPAVGLGANITFTLDAGSAASHSPQTSGRISSLLTGTNGTSNSSALAFSTATLGSLTEKMRISNTGHVGIGTINPNKILEAYSASGANELRMTSTNMSVGMGISSGNNFGFVYVRQNFPLVFGTNDAERLRITNTGYVGIGTSAPTHLLSVRGAVRAQEVIVDNTGWADYVFEEGYPLTPLSEVEAHIRQKRHLPGIPSAADVEQSGVNIGDMQAKLLAKVEELTLHLIAQEKRLNGQAERIAALEKENAALRMP